MDGVRRRLLIGLGAGLSACVARPTTSVAPARIDKAFLDREFPSLAARARPAFLNAGVIAPATGEAWVWDQSTRMPLQGVMAAPLAAAALAQVDAGRLTLNERIHVTADDLSPPPGPLDAYFPEPPQGRAIDLPAIDLIALAVQRGDNTAADAVMKRIGGPAATTAWLNANGVSGMSIDRYARDLQQTMAGMPPFRPEWKDRAAWLAARDAVPAEAREAATNAYLADPRDTTTVPAALEFLRRLALGLLVSPASTHLLLRLMTETDAGSQRLRAGLPSGATLAHMPGTAITDLGLTPAVNDIGLVGLADGRSFAVAAFLAGSSAAESERDRLIADVARLFRAAIH